MERRLKERLIGATILVVLVVLIVPEFLPGPKHGAGPPEADTQGNRRYYTVDVDNIATQPPTLQAPASAASVVPTAPVVPAAASAQPAASAAPAPPAAAAPAVKPPAAPPSAGKSAAAAQIPAPTAAKPAPAPAASRSGWILQLGSFASKANAETLIHQLKGEGFSAYDSPIGSGAATRYRVRLGPIADRAAATALIQRLQAHQHNAILVPPAG